MAKNSDSLRELLKQQNLLGDKVFDARIENAKQKGKVVSSIDKLVCDKHPGAKFQSTGLIPDSYFQRRKKNKNGLSIYECKACDKDENVFDKSKAHECTFCGIVVGKFSKVPYCSSQESWAALGGREGEHYHCKICGTQLGSHYWKYS
ncbi:MAG: hypothetical protein AABX39_01910 [Nanoarchaeota archaeon]